MDGRRLQRFALARFGRLPKPVRLAMLHTVSASHSVGAMCVVQRADDAILFVRHTYRDKWGLPGGLARRREDIADAARRETREEVGLAVELVGEPSVAVYPLIRQVDVIFLAHPVGDGADAVAATPRSVEIAECRWFTPGSLPPMQAQTAGAIAALARAGVPVERLRGITPPGS